MNELADLPEEVRKLALERFRLLQPHLENNEPLASVAQAAGLRDSPADTPLLRSAIRKTGKLTERAMHANGTCQMVKRRLRDAGLPTRLSPHSFRVMIITDLLEQFLDEWLTASGLSAEPGAPLFPPTLRHGKLAGRLPLAQADIYSIIPRYIAARRELRHVLAATASAPLA